MPPLARPVVLLAAALAVGCGGGRKACYPVSGTVVVDGKAAPDALVQFHSHDPVDLDGPHRLLATAMTDEGGKFRISTYGDEDGAPAGEYTVTVTLRERSGLLKNQFDGPDRLKGRYATKDKSDLRATVNRGATELPPFQLSTK